MTDPKEALIERLRATGERLATVYGEANDTSEALVTMDKEPLFDAICVMDELADALASLSASVGVTDVQFEPFRSGSYVGKSLNDAVEQSAALKTVANMREAFAPFLSVRDQYPESIKLINKAADEFTLVSVSVTKGQFLAAINALEAATLVPSSGGEVVDE